jgi:hypothetical protein
MVCVAVYNELVGLNIAVDMRRRDGRGTAEMLEI